MKNLWKLAAMFLFPVLLKGADGDALTSLAQDAEVVEARSSVPRLKAAAAYEPVDNIVDVDISEYAGYAGLIVANVGLAPTEDSLFFKKHGFKVRLTLSEEDSWSGLNSGRMAASVTTADVLPLYGRQLQAVVPALIGYSRGADGIVVRNEIKTVNDLKGKTLATAQFNEADFLLRFLGQQAGMEANLLETLASPRDPGKVNIVACADSFGAGDLFLRDLKAGRKRIDGCVTWDPKTTEVVEGSGGKARLLMSNRNLLVVADILLVNKGFADNHPDKVAGLVAGLLEGNRRVRESPAAHIDVLAAAFKWEKGDVVPELGKVHLANLPENEAFFAGTIDAAGSYGYIYESAVQAYGSSFIPRPVSSDVFLRKDALDRAKATGEFSGQRAEIKPIGATESNLETPLLARDIRFLFQPNSCELDMANEQNLDDLKYMATMLNIGPGSTLLLRGHVDNARVPEFQKQGGAQLVQRMAMSAVKLSKDRCDAVLKALVQMHKVDAARVESVGLGWREPLGSDMDKNRRVEVQWFTIE
jgi:NitT/TauT family transport system substrate-binding protein